MLGLPAGHHPPLQEAPRRWLEEVPRKGRNPAERHAPGNLHRRNDAHSPRHREHGMGRSLGHRHQDVRLHEPHPDAGSPREVARQPLREAPPASPPDHLRNQRTLPAHGQHEVARRQCPPRPHEPHRGRRLQDGPHGLPLHRGFVRRERRGRSPLRPPEDHPLQGLLRTVAWKVQQQDERRDAASLGPQG